MTDADELREELLERAAGERSASGAGVTGSAPERVLYQVPPLQLLAAVALQPITIGLIALVPVVGVVALLLGAWGLGLGGLLFLATPFLVAGGQFVNHFGFSVSESTVGLRLRFGLTSHRSQTVPPGRVQAVRIERPLLWRHWGRVRVVVNVAGSAGGDEAEERPSVLLPVAPEPIARMVLQRVLPEVD